MKRQLQLGDADRGNEAGLTLLELLVAMGIASIVLAAVATLVVFTAKSFLAISNYDDLDRHSRLALDMLSRDVRQARGVIAYETNQLTLQDKDGATLVYRWTPSTGGFVRATDSSSTILLTGCDYLSFGIYQRNPSNSFGFYPATNTITGQFEPAMCKMVDVSWRCSRQIYGKKVNTESVQTAKIVMRN